MSNKSLVIAGQPLALNVRDGAINEKGSLTGVRVFVATKAGLSMDAIKEMSFKEVKALVESKGLASKDTIKGWAKAYDTHRAAHYADSSRIGGLFIASPEWRKSFKPAYNKAGDCIGGALTFRKERSKTANLASQLADARAQIAALKAAAGLPATA